MKLYIMKRKKKLKKTHKKNKQKTKQKKLSVIIPCETQFVACDLYAWSSCSVEVILKNRRY